MVRIQKGDTEHSSFLAKSVMNVNPQPMFLIAWDLIGRPISPIKLLLSTFDVICIQKWHVSIIYD